MVALAILADVEPVRPARRKKRNLAINLVKMSVSAQRTVFPGRQDAGLYGRRDARRYIFRLPLGIPDTHSRRGRGLILLMMGLTPENLRRRININHGKGKNSETRKRLQSRF
jgi:hypothetical protein